MDRIMKIRKELTKAGLDSLFIMSPYNLRYATNFTGTAGAALITHDHAYFITDFRYQDQAAEQAAGYHVVIHKEGVLKEVKKLAEKHSLQKVGFEQDHMTYALWKSFSDALSAELVAVSGLIENIRMIKSAEELQIIRSAADIADAAFNHILDYLQPGTAEIDIANELEFFMRKSGAASSSFDIIVASGWRSSLPHGVATDKLIGEGDMVTLDYGALYNGYVSDITRTVAVGEPPAKLKEVYQTVLDAQLLAVDKIKPHMTAKEADALARDLITDRGYGDYFGHSLGHGIGLEVHENPGLSSRSDVELLPGMTVTAEPGIYIPDLGGVRIEDDLLITETGNDLLTHSTKELLIL